MFETKYLYTIKNGEFSIQQNFFVEFKNEYFDSGTFRNCYKGIIVNKYRKKVKTKDFKTGDCVVKVPKNKNGNYNYKIDFICSEYANSLAQKYNKEVAKIPDKLNFILPYGTELDIFEGEKGIVSVEPYLEGKYIKFYNNDGAPGQKYKSLTAYTHYTWKENEGKRVITDIQGIKENNKFYLTDPAIQSIEGKYGESDLGVQGLIKFLLFHKCNDICREWRWIEIDKYFKLTNYEKASIRFTKYSFQQAKNEKYLPIYIKLLELIGF